MAILKHLLLKIWIFISPVKRRGLIVILSHMRSGSSLLEHILSSNNEILGSGERSRYYESSLDFDRLELSLRTRNKALLKPYSYILDQILHYKYFYKKELFERDDIKYIFLLRSPLETLSSIELLNGNHYGMSKEAAHNSIIYYRNRIEELKSFMSMSKEKYCFFLTYHELTHDTENTLQRLTAFLELKKPLTKKYNLKKTTGHLGDRSKNIKKGEVVITDKKLISIDPDIGKELQDYYLDACNYFNKNKIGFK